MANSVVSETTKKLFTADTLRIAAKHSIGCFVVPVRLRRAIKKYIRDNEDRHVKKKVLRLSQSLNEIKATNLLIAASETSRQLMEDPQSRTTQSSRRWKIQSSYGDNGLVYRDDETIAYVASRMPAVFSACYRVLSELHTRLPGFTPTTVLDFGAGTGSAFWALRELWPKSLKKVNIVEPSQSMQRAGQGLIQGLKNLPTIHSYDSIKNLCKKLKMPERKHDIVIASYVIGEIPSTRDRITTVRQLWQLTKDILVLIEPGTPQGFKTISQMRSHILWMEKRKLNKLNAKKDEHCRDLTDPSQGAHIVAPCSHDGACPLERTGTYCHFVQRLQRTNTQRQFKTSNGRALRGFEDEKFSFVVIRRGQRPKEAWPLDAMYFENLKEQKARLKQEGLGIYHEDDFEEEEALKTHQASYDSDDTTNIDAEREEEEEETNAASNDSDDTTNIDETEAQEDEEDEEEEDSDDANDFDEEEEKNQLINASDREMDEEDESGGEQKDDEGSEARANLGGGWGRIVFSPICRGRHVILNVCRSANAEASSGAYKQIIMTKSKNPTLHRHARKSMWGDLWPN